VKKATIFVFVIINGTWVLSAYLLHANGVRPGLIAIVVTVGVLLGNLATYAGVRLAGIILRKIASGNSN
jgi:membrane protein DedA with SNARE-associated domain